MKNKSISILILALMLSVTFTILVFAEPIAYDNTSEAAPISSTAETSPAVENNDSAVDIEKSEKWDEEEFCILLDHRNDDNLADDIPLYYRSVKDIIADLGDGLYYPSFEPFENNKNAMVMHTGRGIFDREKGKWESDYVFQISYCGASGEILFWIELNNSNGGMHDPNAEEYERLGTTFYISDYCEELNGHFTAGELDGNYYSFIAENASQAKQIIDSLKKAE